MSLHDDFRAAIDAELRRTGIPRAHYAKWLDVSPPAVSSVLNGHDRSRISFQRAERWAAALGLRLRIVAERID